MDAFHRPSLLALLHVLHDARSPRIIMSLRPQDPIPEWITHLAVVRGNQVATGLKKDILAVHAMNTIKTNDEDVLPHAVVSENRQGKVLADMENINVQYKDRKVRSLIIFSLTDFALNVPWIGSYEHHVENTGRRSVASPRG